MIDKKKIIHSALKLLEQMCDAAIDNDAEFSDLVTQIFHALEFMQTQCETKEPLEKVVQNYVNYLTERN